MKVPSKFISQHPVLSTIIAIVAISGVVQIIRGVAMPSAGVVGAQLLGFAPSTPPGYQVFQMGDKWIAVGQTSQTVGQPILHWNGQAWLRT